MNRELRKRNRADVLRSRSFFLSGPSVGERQRGFTLIEIMIVVGIMAVIMTVAIPFMGQQLHKDSMRKALADITEACSQARARAVLNGVATEVRIRPASRSISAVEAGAQRNMMPSFGAETEPAVEKSGGGSPIFSATLSDQIIIEYIEVNGETDLQQLDEVSCSFYKDGTADSLGIVLRSTRGEVRTIKLDLVTGIPDIEVNK
jgi:prepilin-type N-terminal cleavage/methylation domain-containing protein